MTNGAVGWRIKAFSSPVEHERGWLARLSTCPDSSLVQRFFAQVGDPDLGTVGSPLNEKPK